MDELNVSNREEIGSKQVMTSINKKSLNLNTMSKITPQIALKNSIISKSNSKVFKTYLKSNDSKASQIDGGVELFDSSLPDNKDFTPP